MLEHSGAIRQMRTAHKMKRTTHFNRTLLPIIQSQERVDAITGGLATMLFLHMLDIVRADMLHAGTTDAEQLWCGGRCVLLCGRFD